MPDHITPIERAAIDAAIAAGRVTIVPRGQSAFEIGAAMTWRQDAAARWAQKKAADRKAKAAPKPVPRAVTNPAPPKRQIETVTRCAQREWVAVRRKRVADLAARGLSVPQIAAETGLGQRMIRDDLDASGMRAVKAQQPKRKAAFAIIADERAAKIKAQMEAGASLIEAAKAIGCARETARLDMIRIGYWQASDRQCKKGRAQQVADLHAQHPDWSAHLIAERLGVARTYVRKVARKLGLPMPMGR